MSCSIKCACSYLTVNPWGATLEKRAARITASNCPLHGTGPIRWKPADDGFVWSHSGTWQITPIYGGLTRPESYELWRDGVRVGSGQTQRECKEVAEGLREQKEGVDG